MIERDNGLNEETSLEVEVLTDEPLPDIGRTMSVEEKMKVRRLVRRGYKDILKSALVRAYVERGKHLIDHAVDISYEDNMVLVALMKKILPDKSDPLAIGIFNNFSKEEEQEYKILKSSVGGGE